MVRLPSSRYPEAGARYCSQDAYFPLIAAVLSGEQNGAVHADRALNPAQFYVEHAFGFAQIFGESVGAFEHALQRHLLVSKAFSSAKVRLYTPHYPDFLRSSECDGFRSWRQHFQLDRSDAGPEHTEPQIPSNGLALVHAQTEHMGLIHQAFGMLGQFWRNPVDFTARSNAVMAMVDGQPAAICYAAAVAGGKAEIDVLTLPAYRHLGLGKSVVREFNQRCIEQGVQPLWDCFTNNAASMALCRSAGFIPLGEPYAFFTVNR